MDPLVILITLLLIVVLFSMNKQSFNTTISGSKINNLQPKVFPPINTSYPPDVRALAPPTIKEEIGLGIVYPQGSGVGMSKLDSNSFTKPGGLLTNYSIPTAYGESNLIDPTGRNGAGQGSRIIKIKSTGNQMDFKPSENLTHDATFINGNKSINYSDSFIPENNLKLQSSPGQTSSLNNCETTYPSTEHIADLCITEGDIPYGQVVNGKVNPRLVSRWQSYTGDYSRREALQDIDGLLYPKLTVLTNPN